MLSRSVDRVQRPWFAASGRWPVSSDAFWRAFGRTNGVAKRHNAGSGEVGRNCSLIMLKNPRVCILQTPLADNPVSCQTLKARSLSPTGPWEKQYDAAPFTAQQGTYYSATASPGDIVKHKGRFDGSEQRTLLTRRSPPPCSWTSGYRLFPSAKRSEAAPR
jgi:hypothetical protein